MKPFPSLGPNGYIERRANASILTVYQAETGCDSEAYVRQPNQEALLLPIMKDLVERITPKSIARDSVEVLVTPLSENEAEVDALLAAFPDEASALAPYLTFAPDLPRKFQSASFPEMPPGKIGLLLGVCLNGGTNKPMRALEDILPLKLEMWRVDRRTLATVCPKVRDDQTPIPGSVGFGQNTLRATGLFSYGDKNTPLALETIATIRNKQGQIQTIARKTTTLPEDGDAWGCYPTVVPRKGGLSVKMSCKGIPKWPECPDNIPTANIVHRVTVANKKIRITEESDLNNAESPCPAAYD